MKIKDRVKKAPEAEAGWEKDSIDKLIAIAYYMGRESATREVSDAYRKRLKDQKERADKCGYHEMARKVLGDTNYIYFPDYAGDISDMFGDDETEF